MPFAACPKTIKQTQQQCHEDNEQIMLYLAPCITMKRRYIFDPVALNSAFDRLNIECPEANTQLAVVNTLVFIFSSLLHEKETSKFQTLTSTHVVYRQVLKRYPSTLTILNLGGYDISVECCVMAFIDPLLLRQILDAFQPLVATLHGINPPMNEDR
jgi:hypothetical protein